MYTFPDFYVNQGLPPYFLGQEGHGSSSGVVRGLPNISAPQSTAASLGGPAGSTQAWQLGTGAELGRAVSPNTGLCLQPWAAVGLSTCTQRPSCCSGAALGLAAPLPP